ncbi:Shedu anti-phage system protein SduA domain-containing protein [Ramlibacter humi]|uniref:DUF4263 domain-containing protein n=1 Tax=Ramlibacter humi TaxID=2530451 RepID=A0A4Z0C8D1_9BURK|nr:Shedu anti-phage system protein SduA domain-containing protein [Ramlibacter humi]TFZ07873.1 DUF4263 domain-containing protein [Ramlibacter humi]
MTLRIRSSDEVVGELLAADPLRDFFTWWDSIESSDLSGLAAAIDSAKREEDVQQYLQANPKFLIQHLGGGHGRWVIPKARLGSEHVTDFLIAERHSFGFEWQAVELESPLRPMFNRNGDPSQHLNHAIRQIVDWRAWLKSNQAYAARPRAEQGLGLIDIDANVRRLILIGRRARTSPETSARRRQLGQDLNISIHSYDYLLSSLEGRLKGLRMMEEDRPDET